MDPEEVRIEPYIVKDVLQDGDVFLLCSDGLTDMVDNLTISQLLSQMDTPEQGAKALLKAALDGGGKDNITAIVCRVRAATLG